MTVPYVEMWLEELSGAVLGDAQHGVDRMRFPDAAAVEADWPRAHYILRAKVSVRRELRV